MKEIKVGDRVEWINAGKTDNTYYPPPGTRGTVLACEGGPLFVKWDSGVKSKGNFKSWYCDFDDVRQIRYAGANKKGRPRIIKRKSEKR